MSNSKQEQIIGRLKSVTAARRKLIDSTQSLTGAQRAADALAELAYRMVTLGVNEDRLRQLVSLSESFNNTLMRANQHQSKVKQSQRYLEKYKERNQWNPDDVIKKNQNRNRKAMRLDLVRKPEERLITFKWNQGELKGQRAFHGIDIGNGKAIIPGHCRTENVFTKTDAFLNGKRCNFATKCGEIIVTNKEKLLKYNIGMKSGGLKVISSKSAKLLVERNGGKENIEAKGRYTSHVIQGNKSTKGFNAQIIVYDDCKTIAGDSGGILLNDYGDICGMHLFESGGVIFSDKVRTFLKQ